MPAGASGLTRERLVHLHSGAAKWHLYEDDERHDSIVEIDFSDRETSQLTACAVRMRLPHWSGSKTPFTQCSDCCLRPKSRFCPAEIAFRWRGLEFARARHDASSLKSGQEIVFGIGAEERVLDDRNTPAFQNLVARLRTTRSPSGSRHQPLWRLHPERWLESLVVRDVSMIDERLDHSCLYSQVPAFSASDRSMLDVLTTTRDRQLAVVELKADEDIHLPLPGLDYWSRVEWHHARGEFQQFVYFPGQELSGAPPLLFLAHLAYPSRNRHAASLHFSGDRLDARGHRRTLERPRARDLPEAVVRAGSIAKVSRQRHSFAGKVVRQQGV